MKLQRVLCLCMLLATAWADDFASIIDPRGARPVEHGYKADKCATEKDWPFCTDDDWGPKCPSGCRIQGLLDKTDHELLSRIDKIRRLLDENRQKYRSTDQSSKQTYDNLRDRLTTTSGNDNKYMSLAESLRQRIVDIKIKIERQLNLLEALKARVREQVIEMQRLEVDIDIKLRACKGSCAEYAAFSVDRDSYVALDKQLDQLESMRVNSVETVGSLRVMKSRPLKEVVVPSIYKSGLEGSESEKQKQYFSEVGMAKLTLQAEGATADAPATVKCHTLKVRLLPLRPGYGYGVISTRFGQCPAKPSYPLCSDDQWIEKCPSGCRLEGLIDGAERDFYSRLGQVCTKVQTYQDAISSAMLMNAAVYYTHRKIIVKNHVAELRYVERFEELQRNLTLLQGRSTELSRKLYQIRGHVRQQMIDMRRLEVDIDIKLRACHGSCKHTFVHHIDHQAYSDMESALAKFNPLTLKKAKFPANIKKLVLQPVDRPPISLNYRNIPIVRKKLLTQFEDIDLNQVVLEELFNEFVLED